MGMNGVVLGDAIVDLIMSPDAPAHMQTRIRELWEGIGQVIVKHIQDNAVVTVESGIAVDCGGLAGSTVAEGTGTIS